MIPLQPAGPASEFLPLAAHRSPLAAHRSPLAAHRSPLAAHRSPLAAHRSAFTMAEVIFAIMVLGIGLILLAATFPVGIKQNEKTQDATNAALIAQYAYDQLTKVPASGITPDATWTATPISAYSSVTLPLKNYGDQASPVTPGKALAMAFIDGAFATAGGAPSPDLRAKLVYPEAVYADPETGVVNPTWSDTCPQHPLLLGRAAYTEPTPGSPIPFISLWGYRLEGGTWQENVQWVYPADRRYYWYAFYRQMYDDPAGYPNPLHSSVTWSATQLASVQNDHITRRTYRVTVVACKVPPGQRPIQTPEQIRARTGTTPADYAAQWSSATPGLFPIRVPMADGQPHNLAYTPGDVWLRDAASGPAAEIFREIGSSLIRRGGILLDSWGNSYQIADLAADPATGIGSIKLDRPLFAATAMSPGGAPLTIEDCLPLWLNPNAIAVFPTIVTKQADLP